MASCSVLFRSGDADKLVMVWESDQTHGIDRNVVSPPAVFDWRNQKAIFDDVAALWYPQMKSDSNRD